MDPDTARTVDILRQAAAEVGLTMRIMSAEEFHEKGRRAQLRRGRRFRITRSATEWPLASSWWAEEDAARDRFRALVDEFAGRPGARVELVDEAERTMLAVWPEEA